MKRLFLIGVILMFSSISLTAQKDFEKENVMILPDSELIIAGSTNINKFDCIFNIELISDWKEVKYTRENNFLKFKNLKLKLLTKGFDCGNKRMNEDFQDLLLCDKYPEIEINIDRIEPISKEFSKAYIQVKLAGKTNNYDLPVQVNEGHYIGKFKMNIRDFGLEPPTKALGLIEVDEQIEVRFNLKVTL